MSILDSPRGSARRLGGVKHSFELAVGVTRMEFTRTLKYYQLQSGKLSCDSRLIGIECTLLYHELIMEKQVNSKHFKLLTKCFLKY